MRCRLASLALLLVSASASAQDATSPSFRAYSKFDFVSGEKIVAIEDFTHDAIGDFPGKWNTDASGEIVTLSGQNGRWLKLTKGGSSRRNSSRRCPIT